MPFTLIVALSVLFLTVAFSLQNDQVVAIQFFGWSFKGSLVLILLTTLCLGVVIDVLASMPTRIRKSRQITDLTKRVRDLERPHQDSSRRPYPD